MLYRIVALVFLLINEYQYFWWFTSNTPFLSSNVVIGFELFNENRLLNWSLTQKKIFKTGVLSYIDKENSHLWPKWSMGHLFGYLFFRQKGKWSIGNISGSFQNWENSSLVSVVYFLWFLIPQFHTAVVL